MNNPKGIGISPIPKKNSNSLWIKGRIKINRASLAAVSDTTIN